MAEEQHTPEPDDEGYMAIARELSDAAERTFGVQSWFDEEHDRVMISIPADLTVPISLISKAGQLALEKDGYLPDGMEKVGDSMEGVATDLDGFLNEAVLGALPDQLALVMRALSEVGAGDGDEMRLSLQSAMLGKACMIADALVVSAVTAVHTKKPAWNGTTGASVLEEAFALPAFEETDGNGDTQEEVNN